MPLENGEKEPLLITRVDDPGTNKVDVNESNTFQAMLNPSDFSRTRGIEYNMKNALGASYINPKFSRMGIDRATFAVVLDNTGVVPPMMNAASNLPRGRRRKTQRVEVEDQIKKLRDIVFKYNGKEHEPNHVQLLWGALIMFCRLESMSVKYTLFKPSGMPLRAKIDLKFMGYTKGVAADAADKTSSPDLTHIVVVREGDTLPLLCNQIYKDPAYYLEVARFNQLDDFRRLEPGVELRFPPLA
jgi:hypothetical protein